MSYGDSYRLTDGARHVRLLYPADGSTVTIVLERSGEDDPVLFRIEMDRPLAIALEDELRKWREATAAPDGTRS